MKSLCIKTNWHKIGQVLKRISALILCVLFFAGSGFPVAHAEDTEKSKEETKVRVGWFESGFNTIDEFGRRSGYAYEYERKIAAYTDWTYEYVEGSWSELLVMLKAGEIDMLGDVSYTPERAEEILYSSIPMGTETYFIFASAENTEINAKDYKSLEGKKVGVSVGTIQEDLFKNWITSHNVTVDLLEIEGAESIAINKLLDGEIDAYVTLDSYGNPERMRPVWKIGSSDFYFAVNKNRPDLLTELDNALSLIQDENLYYNQRLYEKYLGQAGTNVYLNPQEKDWLASHGKIRVGYQDNYLAFCAKDSSSGELTGALKDFLAYVTDGMKNADVEFETIAYPTANAAMEALKNGEIDCMFPANLTDYDAEVRGLVMTMPLMRTEMDAVVRSADQKEFVKKENVVVAINEGNPNYDMFVVENYPNWEVKHYKDTPACLEAVANGEADCIIISNYRFNNISKKCEKLHLTTVYTGVDMDYYFAVREGNIQLYSILSKITAMVPESITNAALTFYSTEDAKVDFLDMVKNYLVYIFAAGMIILIVIVILLVRIIRVERKAAAEHSLVSDLNKKVFVDALTSVRNKGAFNEYLEKLQERIKGGEIFDCAIGIFDCDNLKKVNDRHGHDKGDVYIQSASRLICRVFRHSAVFRIGGDEFAAVLMGEDFANKDELIEKFYSEQKEICSAAENKWEEVHVSMGLAVHDPETDNSIEETMTRADKNMYEKKRAAKSK